MKIKILKTKQLVALALALFMVMPMLLANVGATYPTTSGSTPPYLDIVPTGGAASTSLSLLPVQAVHSFLVVDVRVDNYADVNINGGTHPNGVSGASYNVVWNPAVLGFNGLTDGSWLPDESAPGDLTGGNLTGVVTVGQIAFATTNPWAVASNAAGSVSATLNFTVLSAGTTFLTLQPSGSGVPYLVAPEQVGTLVSGHAVTGTLTYNAQYNPMTTISLYQHGTSSSTVGPIANPISQTFQMDIYINNPLAVNIWAWNLGVTWNAAALQLTTITEGTYLNQTGNTVFVPGWVDNTHGDIPQGISDLYLAYKTTNAAAGVLATLTFKVINYASSNINLVQGIPSLDTLSGTTPTAVTPAPILNNATYVSNPPPAPTAPVAVITNDTPLSSTQPWYFPSAAIELDALKSIPGSDPVSNPINPTQPITTYTWTASPSLPTGTSLTGSTLSFTAPTLTTPTTYTITLTVATAPTTNPSYQDTSLTVSTTIEIGPTALQSNGAGAVIDVYVSNSTSNIYPTVGDYNGYGPGAQCDAFGPQQVMNLVAFVSYNGGSVAQMTVTFNVWNGTQVIATFTNTTNSQGYAFYSYRLPWVNPNPTQSFSYLWNVTASVEVAGNVVSDVMPFQFGYLLSISNLEVTAGTRGDTSNPAVLTFDITSISANPLTCWATYTVMDCNSVPVATDMDALSNFQANGIGAPNGVSTGVVTASGSINIQIPSWAYVGTATIQVNLYFGNPASPGAVTYCPGATTTFQIMLPIPT